MPDRRQASASKPRVRVQVWDDLPGGRRVAVVECGEETVLIAKRGEASAEFLQELEGVMTHGVTHQWSRTWPLPARHRRT